MITIYTKDYCPYCQQAKILLNSQNLPFTEIDVTEDMDTLRKIMEVSQMRTVPQIFVDDECIGGYSDILSLYEE